MSDEAPAGDQQAMPPSGMARLLAGLKSWAQHWIPQEAGPPAAGETDRQFHEKVFPRELQYVQQRREAAGDDRAVLDSTEPPGAEHQLVGVALSGGGIRSATFSLGVLQALERRGVFKFIDYLSTVSGGGFLGTSLSTLMSQRFRDSKGAESLGEFPFSFSETEDEAPTISHLRNNSNYLAPRGPLDYLRVFAVLVRGIILNFLVLLPFLLISAGVVSFFYGQRLLDRIQEDRQEQLLGEMIQRDWAGMNEELPVQGLLSALASQSLIDGHRNMASDRVRDWLRGVARTRDGVRRNTLPPLIRGGDDGPPEGFRDGVAPEEVIERLRLSGVLRNPIALKEVDAVERTVRSSAHWIPKARRQKDAPLSLANLFYTLRSEGVLPRPPDAVEGQAQTDEFEASQVRRFIRSLEARSLIGLRPTRLTDVLNLLEEKDWLDIAATEDLASLRASLGGRRASGAHWTLTSLLEELGERQMLSPTVVGLQYKEGDLDLWEPARESRNLRLILQELYERGQYDPAWLSRSTRPSQFAPPLAYWQEHEIAMVELEILAGLTLKERTALEPPVDLPYLRQRALDLGLLHSPPEEASPRGRRDGRNTFDTTIPSKPATSLPGFWAVPAWAPRLSEQAETWDLHEILHQLWDRGAFDEGFFAQNIDDHAPAYLGRLEVLAEQAQAATREDLGESSPLPGTRFLLRVGLLWILLYPLLLTFQRAVRLLESGRRLAATGLAMLLIAACSLLVYVVLLAQSSLDWVHVGMEWPERLALFLDSPARAVGTLFLVVFLSMVALPFVVALVSDLSHLTRGTNAAKWRDRYERSFSLVLILLGLVAFIEAQPYLIYHYQYLQAGHVWWSLAIGAASLVASLLAGPAIASVKNFSRRVGLAVVALLGPLLPTLVYIHLVLWIVSYPAVYDSVSYRLGESGVALFLLGLAFVAHLINLPIDANSTSLHGFYRDRLSRAYLVREEDDIVVPEDDLPLSQLCPDHSGAPYHLVNTALNLQGTRDPRLRRRRGDFFHFSRDFIGSKQTGYCETRELERAFPHIQTSSAMAISAAAAAPNMGSFTSGPLVVLMALLNIRLGYWIPNPLRVNRWLAAAGKAPLLQRFSMFTVSLFGSFRARPGAYLLIKEMLSMMDGDSPMVNLSDGGHMENTGVFELLRRRCQFIIACDAEADQGMKFGGLAALIRYARIDLGIEIEIHPDDLRLDNEGESRQHCTLGFVRFPATDDSPAEVGFLLYIKSSITGDEDELISEYRSDSPHFPHESTADQFFGERQFEAYRDLGFHICDGLFDALGKERLENFDECGEWFQGLAVSLSPGITDKVRLADIQKELGSIQRMLREEEFNGYFYEIYPELKAQRTAPPAPDEAHANRFRNVFHLVNIQLQLMESVFVSSELGQRANREHPGNRGWMNLFRRWAKAPSFRRSYLASITAYSAPFQQFCKAALGLELEFAWHVLTPSEHEKLQPHAEETGLKSLTRPLAESGQTLILEVAAPGTDPIIMGDALVVTRGEDAEVEAFEMRAGYQGAGMRARALIALRRWTETERLSLGFSEAAAVAAQAEEFDFDHDAEDSEDSETE